MYDDRQYSSMAEFSIRCGHKVLRAYSHCCLFSFRSENNVRLLMVLLVDIAFAMVTHDLSVLANCKVRYLH